MKTKTLLLCLTFCVSYYHGYSQQTIENNKICMDPISGRGAYIGTGVGGSGVCLLCGTASASNVIDGRSK